ncbi:MAG TPA: DUF2169 domain-containing protein [Polyangia bacterium]|jgi:hypothetical protein|nr:DUF2169 domain-containing protein [Polyangia bacterium]
MLQLQNHSPFVPFLAVLPDPDGVDTLQVVVKGTFTIFPRVEIAPVQLPALLQDQFWAAPDSSSLRAASDAHPGKPSTDVAMVGEAWSERGPVAELLVALAVAERRKVVRVIGDRRWRDRGAGCTRPEPFQSMPLRYERAFGGVHNDDRGAVLAAEERNPVGTGFAGRRAPREMTGTKLPNLEDPRFPVQRAGDRPAPACFGFVAPSWRPRRDFAGTYDQVWVRTRAPYLPRDFDRRFLNAASPDLVFDRFLAGGEPVELHGVSRHGPLRFALPAHAPKAAVWMAGQTLTPPVRLETVFIEPDQERLSLTWRATVACDKAALRIRRVEITMRRP